MTPPSSLLPKDLLKSGAWATEDFVRQELKKWAWCPEECPSSSVWIDEFWIPLSYERADLARLGPKLEAFEIKTARDRLNRLPRQVDAFSRIFDRCTAVVAPCHELRALEMLPDFWGLVVLVPDGEGLGFDVVRSAKWNVGTDEATLVRLIWREEISTVLRQFDVPDVESLTLAALRMRLIELLGGQALRDVVRHVLAGRDPAKARIPTRRFRPPS